MSSEIYIREYDDETIVVTVGEAEIGRFDHGEYGWAGMLKVIAMLKEIEDAFGIKVNNVQDIV